MLWQLIAIIAILLCTLTRTQTEAFGNIYLPKLFKHPAEFEADLSFATNGDMQLANLYRRAHNMDNILRSEIHRSHNDSSGATYTSSRKRHIMELLDRERSRLNRLAREDIARRRIPYKERQRSPLGGDIYQCHFNECQFAQDSDGKILGIPSVPGVTHPYYQNQGYQDNYVWGNAF